MPAPRPGQTVRAAVQLSLPLLQKADATFLRKSGCVSCHNNSLTAMTVALARQHRFAVDENIARETSRGLGRTWKAGARVVLRGVGIPGGQDTVSYLLLGLGAAAYQADAATDAMAQYLKARQLPDGRWRVAGSSAADRIE